MKDRHLFRGKRIDNGEWAIGNYAEYHSTRYRKLIDAILTNEGSKTNRYPVDPKTIGQCTGLKDKNGKLIFEGDEVKIRCEKCNFEEDEDPYYYIVDRVVFRWAEFILEDDRVCIGEIYCEQDVEVIGNIHEEN